MEEIVFFMSDGIHLIEKDDRIHLRSQRFICSACLGCRSACSKEDPRNERDHESAERTDSEKILPIVRPYMLDHFLSLFESRIVAVRRMEDYPLVRVGDSVLHFLSIR